MTEKEKRLKQLLIKLNWVENKESDDPLVSIWFSDLIDLLEDYKADRI